MSDEKYARVPLGKWALDVPEIAELVKAAQGMCAGMDDETDGLTAAERRLIAALKPFTREA